MKHPDNRNPLQVGHWSANWFAIFHLQVHSNADSEITMTKVTQQYTQMEKSL